MRKLFIAVLMILLIACNLTSAGVQPQKTAASAAQSGGSSSTPTGAKTQSIRYVTGSTQKICQLVGETDREFNKPTFNQTESRFGLAGNDLGYSFEHNGKLFFLFGDSTPTATFNGKPNLGKDPPRIPNDNDA